MTRISYRIWHHWTMDPDEEQGATSPVAVGHGYWVLRVEDDDLVGVSLWRRRLEWKEDPGEPGLTTRESIQEYGVMFGPTPTGTPNFLRLRDLPRLAYDDDPELLQAFRMIEARELVSGRVETLTGRTLVDILLPEVAEPFSADDLSRVHRFVLEVESEFSYDGWTLELIVDEQFIQYMTRTSLRRLREKVRSAAFSLARYVGMR